MNLDITFSTIASILICHFVADFMLQSDETAKNKSSDSLVLFKHVFIYSLPFLILLGPIYAVVNLIAHFITDYITSRISKRLWTEGRVHDFFVVIGLDQLIHHVALFVSYILLRHYDLLYGVLLNT